MEGSIELRPPLKPANEFGLRLSNLKVEGEVAPTTLKSNLEYWEISRANPEPIIDSAYSTAKLVIPKSPEVDTVSAIRDVVNQLCQSADFGSTKAKDLLARLSLLMSRDGARFSEFHNFLITKDITMSGLPIILADKDNLARVVRSFCEERHDHYVKVGYSVSTVQALVDSGASRSKGQSGPEKIIKILRESGFIETSNYQAKRWCFKVDSNISTFQSLLKSKQIEYDFGRTHQGKLPDVAFGSSGSVFVLEAKHIKEFGGAQDKQLLELVEFVGQDSGAPHSHFVSFLDGIMANKIFVDQAEAQRVRMAKDALAKLKGNSENFYVNTAGLVQIIKDLP